MLIRYWTWTSGSSSPATSSLPFGPLRYRAWTSQDTTPVTPAVTGVAFGPLRYRAWTTQATTGAQPSGGWPEPWWWQPYKHKPEAVPETEPVEVQAQAATLDVSRLTAEADARIRALESLNLRYERPVYTAVPDDYGWEQVLAERQRQAQGLLAALEAIDQMLQQAIVAQREDEDLLLMIAALAV